jgi:hypothetical protein
VRSMSVAQPHNKNGGPFERPPLRCSVHQRPLGNGVRQDHRCTVFVAHFPAGPTEAQGNVIHGGSDSAAEQREGDSPPAPPGHKHPVPSRRLATTEATHGTATSDQGTYELHPVPGRRLPHTGEKTARCTGRVGQATQSADDTRPSPATHTHHPAHRQARAQAPPR